MTLQSDRADLIANWRYGLTAADPVPPAPPADTPPADVYEPDDYTPDPDETVLCPNCECLNDDDASYCDQCGTKLAGNPDVVPPPPDPDDSPDNQAAATMAVSNDTPCADPACKHLASAHADTVAGQNTGGCSMNGCNCESMTLPDDAMSAAMPPVAVAPDVPAPANSPGGDDPSDAPVGKDENQDLPPGAIEGPTFTIPVGVLEGVPTSDGRQIAPQSLTWRTPPLPLTAQFSTEEGHDGGKIVGRIDTITRNGTSISASGVFDTSDDGLEAARRVGNQMFKGVSVDIVDAVSEVTVVAMDDDGFPVEVAEMITGGEIAGWCITPIPAFADCYIVLGDGTGDDVAPIPMDPNEAVAAAINIIYEAECEPCQTGEALAASAGPMAPPDSWFTNPELRELTPIVVTEQGQVYGHIAPFGTCHTGVSGQCVVPPRSKSNYASFRTGRVVTAAGEQVATGRLTMGTGHASTSQPLSHLQAMAHYDNTGTAVADVTAGEDAFGIWVAGSVRPGVTDEQVYALRASPISGDWRKVGTGLELVAALCVNTPGFPIVKALAASGEPVALVAAGVASMEHLRPHTPETVTMSAMERAMMPLLDLSAEALRTQMADL